MGLTYALRPVAEKALKDERARLIRLRSIGIVTTAYVVREIRKFARKMYATAVVDAADVGHIGTRCPVCSTVHVMASDVRFYRCRCTPHVERPTFRHTVPLA